MKHLFKLIMLLLILGLSGSLNTAVAQDGTTTTVNRHDDMDDMNDDDDADGDWGLAGLIGLLGLMGMRKRNTYVAPVDTTRRTI